MERSGPVVLFFDAATPSSFAAPPDPSRKKQRPVVSNEDDAEFSAKQEAVPRPDGQNSPFFHEVPLRPKARLQPPSLARRLDRRSGLRLRPSPPPPKPMAPGRYDDCRPEEPQCPPRNFRLRLSSLFFPQRGCPSPKTPKTRQQPGGKPVPRTTRAPPHLLSSKNHQKTRNLPAPAPRPALPSTRPGVIAHPCPCPPQPSASTAAAGSNSPWTRPPFCILVVPSPPPPNHILNKSNTIRTSPCLHPDSL